MKFLATALGLASAANAHTLFTTLYIDGKNQGDGTCVRQPSDLSAANSPIYPIDGNDMACNHNGDTPVAFVCPASSGAQLTFEFRESPSYSAPGVIAEGHKGPCSVYIKKVDDIFKTAPSGAGWFKIWEDGYNVETDTWCVDTLRANNGHLSVDLPTGLPSGYYLVRPEILALHAAADGDPQFYASCAQIYIENGPDVELKVPEKYSVSIPGYVKASDAALTYNLYDKPLGAYTMPGPEVYIPTSSNTGEKKTQSVGVCPTDCLAKNANWCGKALNNFSTEEGCWSTAEACWNQSDSCWKEDPPSGQRGCKTWQAYCTKINDQCDAKNWNGLPDFDLSEVNADVPGPIPTPYGSFQTTPVDGSSNSGSGSSSSSSASKATATTKASSGSTTVAYSQPAATTTTSKAAATTGDSSADDVSSAYEEPSATNDNSASKETETEASVAPEKTETEAPSPTYSTLPQQTSASAGGNSGLKVSQDGRCGGQTGQTCEGSSFGDCCSKKGRCGRKTRHCSCGCQSAFGKCD